MAPAASITDVQGITVGHGTDLRGMTGCTVVLCGEGAVAGVDVRGLAPATRETDLCRPGTLVERVQAVFLSGGSAYGLAAAAGVMRFLRERGLGFDAGGIRVPIVPAACLFDLGLGEPAWPEPDLAYQACLDASSAPPAQGCVGAGTGATTGKLLGLRRATKSGIGTAAIRCGAATVGAIIAVNAFGDVTDPANGTIVAGARRDDGTFVDTVQVLLAGSSRTDITGNTTIGVIATDAQLSPSEVQHLAGAGHDGLARVIRPVHTMVDGDVLFGLATGQVPSLQGPSIRSLAVAATVAVERAVLRAVNAAIPLGGLPAARLMPEVAP